MRKIPDGADVYDFDGVRFVLTKDDRLFTVNAHGRLRPSRHESARSWIASDKEESRRYFAEGEGDVSE